VRRFLRYIEIFTVLVFTVEYLLRVYVADRKRSFIFSFFGLVDLLAILPFYVSAGIDLRSVRAIRLFRLFRALKVVRYSRAIRRFHQALLIAKEEIILFALVAALLLFLSAVGIYYCENQAQPEVFASVFHSLWWSVCTLTTVGYGDVYPVTVGGKIFTFFVLATGLGIISVPAGLVASALSKAREIEDNESSSGANSHVPNS
jgi:voltage-gated potassium channel